MCFLFFHFTTCSLRSTQLLIDYIAHELASGPLATSNKAQLRKGRRPTKGLKNTTRKEAPSNSESARRRLREDRTGVTPRKETSDRQLSTRCGCASINQVTRPRYPEVSRSSGGGLGETSVIGPLEQLFSFGGGGGGSRHRPLSSFLLLCHTFFVLPPFGHAAFFCFTRQIFRNRSELLFRLDSLTARTDVTSWPPQQLHLLPPNFLLVPCLPLEMEAFEQLASGAHHVGLLTHRVFDCRWEVLSLFLLEEASQHEAASQDQLLPFSPSVLVSLFFCFYFLFLFFSSLLFFSLLVFLTLPENVIQLWHLTASRYSEGSGDAFLEYKMCFLLLSLSFTF